MNSRQTWEGSRIVLANWKAHLSPAQAEEWVGAFARLYRPVPETQVILAVPFLAMPAVHGLTLNLRNVAMAAQDVSPFPPGGYTGATPAAWLADVAGFVLVGHRERRRYFHETVQDAANKVSEAVAAGLCPILCLPDADVVRHLAPIDSSDLERLVLAYTPEDAEALEVARNRESIAATVRQLAEAAGGRPVLYGGGVNAANVTGLVTIANLAGVMTAGGSLDPAEFVLLLNNVNRASGQGP